MSRRTFSLKKNEKNKVLVALLMLLLWRISSAALHAEQSLSPVQASNVDATVEMEMNREHVVGIAVGIIRNDDIVYLKGYGLADRENNIPVTTDTMFRWASCTKPLTAIAALQLAEKGRLDLDADVRRYVPEFPDKGVTITARELLCHESGIVHYSNGKVIVTRRRYDAPHPFADPVMALDTFKESPLLFRPGERFSYSSYGYILLSAVIERAGRETFAAQIVDRIARPLGMTTLQPDYEWVNIPNRAVGYQFESGSVVRSTDTDTSWKWGAGGYISDIRDFAVFAKALLEDKLVDEETQTEMWTPQKTLGGRLAKIGALDYGLGFEIQVGRTGQLIKVCHDGAQEKTRTRLVIYPGLRNGVVVMTNCEWVDPGIFSTLIYRALQKE